MTTEEYRELVERDDFQPFIIRTAGREYLIKDPTMVWVPGSYESMAVLALPGTGITLLDIRAIETIQLETAIP